MTTWQLISSERLEEKKEVDVILKFRFADNDAARARLLLPRYLELSSYRTRGATKRKSEFGNRTTNDVADGTIPMPNRSPLAGGDQPELVFAAYLSRGVP